MRKISSYLFVLILLLASVSALKIIENEDEVSITTRLNENLYVTAGKVKIDAPINGDIVAFVGEISVDAPVNEGAMIFGGTLNVNSQIKGPTHVCGGTININGAIDGDLMSCGGTINVNGNVNEDIRIMGGNIGINGPVKGDILILGGSVNINGPVGGDVAITAGELTINGVVEGNVIVAADKIKLGEDALIKGNFTYTSKSEAALNPEQVKGTITKKLVKKRPITFLSNINRKITGALALLLLGIVLVLIMPNMSNRLSNNIKEKFWKTLLFGLLALIVTPIAALLIMITVIGIPIAIILLTLYVLAIYISKIFAALYVGKLFFKKPDKYLLKPIIAGIIIYIILVNIPYISGLVRLLAILLGLGAMTLVIFTREKKKAKRKKR